MSETAERRAQKAVAVSFWLLAPYIAVEAIRDLAAHHPASATPLGIALTASVLVIMPVLGIAKHRLGKRLGSGATAGEGTQNLMCAAQAAGVLLALVVVARWRGGLADRPDRRARHRRLVGLGGKPVLARRRLLLTRRDRGADAVKITVPVVSFITVKYGTGRPPPVRKLAGQTPRRRPCRSDSQAESSISTPGAAWGLTKRWARCSKLLPAP